MRVTFLGTGSAMPTGERAQTGLLVTADGAEPLVVDCGSGVLSALARTDTGYEGADTVLLTHHHLDHVSDLLALLKARWLAGETTLTVAGPTGTRDLLDGLLDVHDYLRGRVDLTVREVGDPGTSGDGEDDEGGTAPDPETPTFELAGYELSTAPMVHAMPGYAYRLAVAGTDGPAFTFSGDTEATAAVADLADGSAVLAHDCAFPDEVDVSNHPTPTRLGEVLAGREIGRTYLTHLYPHTDGKHGAMLDAIGEVYDGEVRIARDGLSVTVS
jgi:ribonuclease BN (tRNA processing enzyme)